MYTENTDAAAHQAAASSQPKTRMPAFLQGLYARYGSWTKKLSSAVLDQAAFAGSSFIINVLLARWMTADQYGAFVVAYSWFLLPQNLYEATIIEPMTINGSGKFAHKFKKYLGYVFRGHIWVSGVIMLVLVTAGGIRFATSSETLVAMALVGMGLASPLLLTRWLTRYPFYVISQPHLSALGNTIYLVLGVAFIVLLNFTGALTPITAILGMAFAGVAASAYLTTQHLKPDFDMTDDELNPRLVLKEHWDYGKWSSASRLQSWAKDNVYFLVLPLVMSLGASGALRALVNLVLPITMTFTAVTAILLPNFVRTYENNGKAALTKRLQLIMAGILGITFAYMLVVTFLGGWIVDLLYDGRYNEFATFPILATLGAIPMLTATLSVMDAALRAIGGVKQTFFSKLLPAVLTLVLSVPMLSNFGLVGANVSTIIVSLTMMAGLVWFYIRAEDTSAKAKVA